VQLRFLKKLLEIEELSQARTHEFVLSWRSAEERPYQQTVRQQYTFSPPGTTRQMKAYQTHLLRRAHNARH
jgi:hypothetical protein